MGVERGPKSLLKGRFNNLNVYLIFVGNGKVLGQALTEAGVRWD